MRHRLHCLLSVRFKISQSMIIEFFSLIRPGRYNSRKPRTRSQDEEIPLNNRR